MRYSNFARLRTDRHLQWLDGRRQPLSHIFLPAAEMTGKLGLHWPAGRRRSRQPMRAAAKRVAAGHHRHRAS
jgi:hypothetical protein